MSLTSLSPPEMLASQSTATDDRAARTDEVAATLSRHFGVEFAIFDGETGENVRPAADQPCRDESLRGELCREVARCGKPSFIEEEDPLLALAIPLPVPHGSTWVAVATFVTRPLGWTIPEASATRMLGIDAREAESWLRRQTPWCSEPLQRMADLFVENWRAEARVGELEREADTLSNNIGSTYEEITLLYRLTQNLKISQTDDELGRLALTWLEEVVPAKGLAIQLLPVCDADEDAHDTRIEPLLMQLGTCPVDSESFAQLVDHLGMDEHSNPFVANPPVTLKPDWPYPGIRQIILVPLSEGDKLFGWLGAFNHTDDEEFGTVEANLLSSVATMLGIHSANIDLYRQQAELLAGIVRALTSAIDAKDPYTCGHSERVARISVRLAQELGYDAETTKTIYMAGLLHDVGKIGITDSVLRKPGKLTAAEFEHIKTHTTIGFNILSDLKSNIKDVLPIVHHHHESWDGTGYPMGLAGEEIPILARVAAVADAFDAMGSDRPYRDGMPDEKLDEILRKGAGQQWDADIVDAFFRARDDIRRIAQGKEVPDATELDQLS